MDFRRELYDVTVGGALVNNQAFYFAEIDFFTSRRRNTNCSRDWSSDVCSSDLPLWCPQQKYFPLQARQPLEALAQPPLGFGGDRPLVRIAVARSQIVGERHHAGALGAPVRVQIGRASCRESVDLGGRRIIKKKK